MTQVGRWSAGPKEPVSAGMHFLPVPPRPAKWVQYYSALPSLPPPAHVLGPRAREPGRPTLPPLTPSTPGAQWAPFPMPVLTSLVIFHWVQGRADAGGPALRVHIGATSGPQSSEAEKGRGSLQRQRRRSTRSRAVYSPLGSCWKRDPWWGQQGGWWGGGREGSTSRGVFRGRREAHACHPTETDLVETRDHPPCSSRAPALVAQPKGVETGSPDFGFFPSLFFHIYFLLECSRFTVLSQFLLHSKVTQSYVICFFSF